LARTLAHYLHLHVQAKQKAKDLREMGIQIDLIQMVRCDLPRVLGSVLSSTTLGWSSSTGALAMVLALVLVMVLTLSVVVVVWEKAYGVAVAVTVEFVCCVRLCSVDCC
jgi:hypothetical protein